MYKVPSNKLPSFSALSCFGRVLGRFSMLGILTGMMYGGAMGVLFGHSISAVFLGGFVGSLWGTLGGLACGIVGGIITIYALRRPSMTTSRLTWIYAGMIVGLEVMFIFLSNMRLYWDWEEFETNLYSLILPVIIGCACGANVAKRMIRWRDCLT